MQILIHKHEHIHVRTHILYTNGREAEWQMETSYREKLGGGHEKTKTQNMEFSEC